MAHMSESWYRAQRLFRLGVQGVACACRLLRVKGWLSSFGC